MKVLAEGIETDEQRVLLRLAGCDEMQGFLFAAPRPPRSTCCLSDLIAPLRPPEIEFPSRTAAQ
jgi:EAL domain-containing protein (putative c-di-GMP-specific phosphodiesterase class I)